MGYRQACAQGSVEMMIMKRNILILFGALALMVGSLTSGAKPPEMASRPGETPTAVAPGLLELYAQNRAQGIPNYITEDLLLLGYSLVAKETTKELEDERVRPLFEAFLAELTAGLERLPPSDKTTPVTQANRDFLGLLGGLLEADKVGDRLATLGGGAVQAEYELVLASGGIQPSPLWGYPLDYGQFKPRGRYSESAALAGYFRAMRYAGAVLFPVQSSRSTGITPETVARMTAQTLQLVKVMGANPQLEAKRTQLEELLAWRFGVGEDLADADLRQVLGAALGDDPAKAAQALFAQAKKTGRQPQILGGLVDLSQLEAGLLPRDVLTGWRLLPSRYSAESAAFQRLVYNATGEYQGSGTPAPFGLAVIGGQRVKGYPSSLELLALQGSKAALGQLRQAGEDRFVGYDKAFAEAKGLLRQARGLNGAHLDFMREAFTAPATNPGNRDQAIAAFWTWQRYLDVLYAKQSYTLTGKGLELDPSRPGATLEPSTSLYKALAKLIEEQRRHGPERPWAELGQAVQRIVTISTKLERGKSISRDDEAFLNDLDRKLLALGGGTMDAPIIVDVHVNPAEGKVVEEATAWASLVEKGPARGARLSHREFKQPLAERLDDAGWRRQLAEEKPE